MTHYGLPARPQRMLRCWGLLVGALLLGLLGMHGLGPGPGIDVKAGHHRMAADSMSGSPAVCVSGQCDHGDHGDHGGGQVHHASAMCVSASIAGPPELPALQPALMNGAASAEPRTCDTAGDPKNGRAPPSLSELQLLRI
ncbi:DUF6153 family protein [Streptomyces sp. NPDC053542]|uniref:DUF6153 family protein n=1 Tax=Streptomyces sp. NPDC053542 TaxID=3365710 RepID=UPI0037CED386